MDALLMLVLSVSILATLQIIGVTLVAATLVIPAVVARMSATRSAACCGSRRRSAPRPARSGCTCPGTSRCPSGTTIVLVNALAFVVVLAVTGGRSLRRAAGPRRPRGRPGARARRALTPAPRRSTPGPPPPSASTQHPPRTSRCPTPTAPRCR
jgi:manganese/iron transport system permease protein/iron/zinc/copper transport system permease protein